MQPLMAKGKCCYILYWNKSLLILQNIAINEFSVLVHIVMRIYDVLSIYANDGILSGNLVPFVLILTLVSTAFESN